ncbi:hypothetical protein FMM74_002170 [Lachnospiraceae bacterium MD308]|nr:hypothetical protein [Lachnospiraceae bacterium MD308]
MEKKYRKRICLCIGLFIICVLVGFMVDNFMSEDCNIEYESLNTEHKTDMTKKKDYQKADLEMKLQNSIQSIAERSNPLVSIDNFDVKDHSKTTVVVTLYTEPRNEISEELRMAIENLISGSFNGILRDNISIDIEYTEKE